MVYTPAMNWDQLQASLREQIRQRRGAQVAIATRLGVSRAAVGKYVSGENEVPAGHLDAILEELGLELQLVPRAKRD